MKALVLLSHSWSKFLTLTCLYAENEYLWGTMHPSGVFSAQIAFPTLELIGQDGFRELFLSNIMKYGKNDIEWQTNIQGMSLSDFRNYVRKRKGSFNKI